VALIERPDEVADPAGWIHKGTGIADGLAVAAR